MQVSQSLHSKLPDGLVAIAVRDDQEDPTCGMDELARQVEQVMANGFDRRSLIARRQHEAFEPGHQIKGQLSDEEVSPVGVELLRRELLQPQAALMLLDSVFHIGML